MSPGSLTGRPPHARPPGVAVSLTSTARKSIIPAEPGPAPGIPIKRFTPTLVASSRLGITSSIFPRWTEPTGQAEGTRSHPLPISGAGLITTGTHFNQEELRHSGEERPSAFPGTSIHLRWRRKTASAPPGQPRVYASALPVGRTGPAQPELWNPKEMALGGQGRPSTRLMGLRLRTARPLVGEQLPDGLASAPPRGSP